MNFNITNIFTKYIVQIKKASCYVKKSIFYFLKLTFETPKTKLS